MAITSKEIIGDITDHIRKFGGDFAAWGVAIARDWHDPVFESRQSEAKDDELICREAYTPASARAVRDYFVSQGTVAGADVSIQVWDRGFRAGVKGPMYLQE